MDRERWLVGLWSLLALARRAVASASAFGRYGSRALIVILVVAAACSSVEKHEKQEKHDAPEPRLGKTSSALTIARYEGEAMSWSGVEGADRQIRTAPAPKHRYFWTNGYVAQNHNFVGGSTTLVIRAMGDLLGGVGPHIVVSVGGTQVGAAFVNETAYASKTFTFDAAAGVQQVRATFDNDDARSTEDRNLLLDWIEVQEPPPSGVTCSDTSYEGEAMAWSGVEGADGEIRTDPSTTHRYFRQNGYASQSHTFSAQPTPSRRPTASGRSSIRPRGHRSSPEQTSPPRTPRASGQGAWAT